MMLTEIDSVGMYDIAAEEMGKTLISTELGGGSSSSAASNAIAKRGIANVLAHAGIMRGDIVAARSIMLDMPSDDCFTFSEDDGLFEIRADLEETVTKGQLIARIWPADSTGKEPKPYMAKIDGLVVARHFPGLIKTGDCMLVIGRVA